jgi:hypothetical protein
LKKTFSFLAILAMCFCFSAATAKADGGTDPVLYYTLTGGPTDAPITMTFALPVNPDMSDPDNYDDGIGFQVDPINLVINGTPTNNDCLYFYSLFAGGAFQDFNGNVNLMNPLGSNVMLYSGPESDPTMLLINGPITLTDYDTGTETYTLNVSTVPAPEPVSLMLLASGIVALGLMRKYRTA